jgi:sortase A
VSGRVRYGLAAILILAGLALLARPWWTGLQERAAQRQLAARVTAATNATRSGGSAGGGSGAGTTGGETPWSLLRRGPAEAAPAPWRPPGPPPPVFARLEIPAIGLDSYVVDGATLTEYERVLEWGPGHLEGTPAPGGVGNVVILGHVDEYGAPFRHLDRLKPGDRVVLDAAGRSFDYTVQRSWVVPPTDVSVVAPLQGTRALTLFTCTGTGNADRLIVRATMVTASAAR